MVDVLASVSEAVASGGPMDAVDAGSIALDAGAKLPDVVRAAVLAYGESVDFATGFVPHGMLAMAAAVRVATHVQPRFAPLPALQAMSLLARDAKRSGPRPPSRVITGEITHLARSFEEAVRARNAGDAAAVFSGFLADGEEKKMAGDALFRVAAEDASEGGHKLLVPVKAWQLAAYVGWKHARPVIVPAVAYVADGEPDVATHESLLRAWGKAQVDSEGLSRNAQPLGHHATDVSGALAAPTAEECARALIDVLKAGVAVDALAEGLVIEAGRRVLAARHFDFPAVHDVLFADAARFVATFSRTSSRVFPVLIAGLRIRGKAVSEEAPPVVPLAGEGEVLCAVSGDIDHGGAEMAAARVGAYTAHGFAGPRLVELLCHHAARETPIVDQGHSLALADAVSENFLRSRDPRRAVLVEALAKALATAPHDRTAWDVLKAKYDY